MWKQSKAFIQFWTWRWSSICSHLLSSWTNGRWTNLSGSFYSWKDYKRTFALCFWLPDIASNDKRSRPFPRTFCLLLAIEHKPTWWYHRLRIPVWNPFRACSYGYAWACRHDCCQLHSLSWPLTLCNHLIKKFRFTYRIANELVISSWNFTLKSVIAIADTHFDGTTKSQQAA